MDKYSWLLEIAAVGQRRDSDSNRNRARDGDRAVPSCSSLSHLGSPVTAGWWPQAGPDEGWDKPLQRWGAGELCPGLWDREAG